MARALGANALVRMLFESVYGAPPAGNYANMSFVSGALGETQGLIKSDLLGKGRHPQKPGQDVVDNQGQIVVPVDLRILGLWLKLLCGQPTSTQGVAASGAGVFSANPANNSTVSMNGTTVTFVTGTPTGSQVKIGGTLADTLTNLALFLNASTDANISPAKYALDLGMTTLQITHGTIGTAGNSFTLAASSSPDSKCTASGSTLAGGSASGPYNHVFVPGSVVLPSSSIEIANPEVPNYGMNFGVKGSTIQIALQRSGLLNATIELIAQGETSSPTSLAGTPTDMVIERFSQFSGLVGRSGVPFGNVVSGTFKLDNGLDPVDVIRPDGRVAGADEGIMDIGGDLVVRYADNVLANIAAGGAPVDLAYGWKIAANKSLTIEAHQTYLPKPQRPITGPKGIQATYGWQAAESDILAKTITITLVNDVAAY